MYRIREKIKAQIADTSGVSSFVSFVIVVMPLIVMIFAILEIANMSNTMISMNRGLMECLTHASTSPEPMTSALRWDTNVRRYILSVGNATSQINPSFPIQYVNAGAFPPAAVNQNFLYMRIETASNTSLIDPAFPVTDYPAQVAYSENVPGLLVPMIRMRMAYRYHFISPFLGYLLGLAPGDPLRNGVLVVSGMETVNEHPGYRYDVGP